MTTLLPSRLPDGQFDSFRQWVSQATYTLGGNNSLCVDSQDRVCKNGGEFMRANTEGTFPVRYWHGAGPQQTKTEERASLKAVERAYRRDYPWRSRKTSSI